MRRSIFDERLSLYGEELRQLYMELYHDEAAYEYFVEMLRRNYRERKSSLKKSDAKREADPGWERSNRFLGMMLYTENYGGDLRGVQDRLSYLTESGVNYLHLMPLLDSPEGKSDGGYAVSDFRRVRPDLGTMEDLESLAAACHRRGILVCLDFVMNHTSEEHEWARAARAGDPSAMGRYFFYDDWSIPDEFSRTLPEVFPETAPGNYTWLDDCGKIVMTSFYPFQWDLNYANPVVFNDMTDNLLYLANRGIDVVRLDAVPYIWKQIGTNCRNLPEVHTLVRMMNLACRLVCPGVLLLGEVVMEPKEVMPYFGSYGRPECDILYNVTTMCTIWHTLATKDVRLLRHQLSQLEDLPPGSLFQNYLRCHDDIGWGLDYRFLGQFGMEEGAHKKFLNDWFTGRFPGSVSRGELYNDSEVLRDARLCGTTASLCGVEHALETGDGAELKLALSADLMLHALMFTLSGIPVIYSGDELCRLNDYSYHDVPAKMSDSRYVHRGAFCWDDVGKRHPSDNADPGNTGSGEEASPETEETGSFAEDMAIRAIYSGIELLSGIRKGCSVFCADAGFRPLDTGNNSVLGIERRYGGETLIGLFNFTREYEMTEIPSAEWHDLLEPERAFIPNGDMTSEYWLEPFGFRWMLAESE